MTTPSATRMLCVTAAAGAAGALTLVEHRRLGPWGRDAYRAGIATLTGLLMADSARHDAPLMDPVRDGIVAGGITFGAMDLLERLDGAVVDALRRAGISRPRLLLAAIGATGTAAMMTLPGGSERSPRWGTPEEVFGAAESEPLAAEARSLLSALLTAPEGVPDLPGAAALREQLVTARSVETGYPGSDVQLVIDAPRRLAVPRQQTWPVTATFVRAGIRYALELQIDDGRLGMLGVMVGQDEPRLEHALDQISSPGFALPDPADITLRWESETP